MLGLTSLEVNNSVFKITEKSNKFELYVDTFDEYSFEELKDEIEESPNFLDITPSHLQHEIIEPRFIETYNKLRLEKSSTDSYIFLLMGYARSPFQDFESYFRSVVGLDKDDIQLIFKKI